MPKGRSLHLGLNAIDPDHYEEWNGRLYAAEDDARSMHDLARAQGFEAKALLTSEATSARVLQELAEASRILESGDTFFFSFAGHGSQITDQNGDEEDGLDETWLLYDRMLIDDELYACWSRFRAGVRILLVSDSCHSGTIARDRAIPELPAGPASRVRRVAPAATSRDTYAKHKTQYDALLWGAPGGDAVAIEASVIALTGCQDNQISLEGDGHGRFTEALLQAWDGGRFQGTYYAFRRTIAKLMPPSQTPNFYTVGHPDPTFESESPFTIAAHSGGVMSSKGSTSYGSGSMAATSAPSCVFCVQMPQRFLASMSDDEVSEFLRRDACDAMLEAFVAARAISEEIDKPESRGRKYEFSISAEGNVAGSSGGTSGGGKVTATFKISW